MMTDKITIVRHNETNELFVKRPDRSASCGPFLVFKPEEILAIAKTIAQETGFEVDPAIPPRHTRRGPLWPELELMKCTPMS